METTKFVTENRYCKIAEAEVQIRMTKIDLDASRALADLLYSGKHPSDFASIDKMGHDALRSASKVGDIICLDQNPGSGCRGCWYENRDKGASNLIIGFDPFN